MGVVFPEVGIAVRFGAEVGEGKVNSVVGDAIAEDVEQAAPLDLSAEAVQKTGFGLAAVDVPQALPGFGLAFFEELDDIGGKPAFFGLEQMGITASVAAVGDHFTGDVGFKGSLRVQLIGHGTR